MKTKTLLLLCLFFGIGLTQLSAQELILKYNMSKDGTGTLQIRINYNFGEYAIPVFCDGQQVDLLIGSATFRGVHRYKNWVFQGANDEFFGGDLHSTISDEVFKFIEKDHTGEFTLVPGDLTPYGILRVDYNINGNEGHHYIGTLLWDIHAQTYTSSVKAICN
ncbi:MAG: hypothetical protein ABR927_18355 [Bacteroidales bacterium]|jgi:hypothetical protein